MKYAIIDVSSSSISLLVAEKEGGLNVLLTDREILSVLHYAKGRNLSERGVEKIADGINRLKEIAINYGAKKCYVISTASVRNFDNYEEVAAEINCATGTNLNLLSGEEEAFCDFVANKSEKSEEGESDEGKLLIDIGGGSIELCDMSAESEEDAVAFLDFGSFHLKEKFVRYTQPDEREARKIKKYVKEKLAISGIFCGREFSTAILVGATNRAIYETYCEYYGKKASECGEVDYEKLKKLRDYLIDSSERSILIVRTAPERIDTFVTSVAALCAVMKYYGISRAEISPFGVKEGYLALVTDGRKQGVTTPLVCIEDSLKWAGESSDGSPSTKDKV